MIIGPNYLDDVDMDGMEIDIGGGFFGNLDDLLNFPDEDVEEGVAEGDIRGFQEEFPIPPDTLENPNSTVPGNINNSSELPTIAREEIDQLEWLSNFVEASLSARDITIANNFNNKDSHHFCSSSPISVLESSSSSSGGKTVMPLEVKTLIPESGRRKRTRTRLMGPPTFNSRKVISLFSSSSSVTELSASDCAPQLENFAESRPSKKLCFWQTKTYYGKNPQKNVQNSAIVKCKPWSKRLNSDAKEKKKRDKKNMFSPPVCDMVQPDGQTIKKCTHCEMTNTPQWREGPSGPRTLCNACGVRYKKGRLFPEYRPAASPTYNPLLHANKHKKVIEIRVKVGQNIKLVENVGSPMPSQDSQKTAPVENVGSTNPSQEQRNTTRARNVGFPKPSQEPLPETEPEQECEFIYI